MIILFEDLNNRSVAPVGPGTRQIGMFCVYAFILFLLQFIFSLFIIYDIKMFSMQKDFNKNKVF